MTELKQTPLHGLHLRLGAKMVAFAGYDMPVQYTRGVMQEHLHTRAAAGLFDVSHMGQVQITGASWDQVATAFERLVPMDVLGLADGRQRYGLFTNAAGGIEDDLMFARRGDGLFVVVNAACKASDLALMQAGLPSLKVTPVENRALLALQGPKAETVLAQLDPRAAQMRFMDAGPLDLNGIEVWASRSGYTGEDGFELSMAADAGEALAEVLLDAPEVEMIGLGARDSLRLEAGLCLYGQDMDTSITPATAGLNWAIQKNRRKGGAREGGFPGAERIFSEFETGPALVRVGLRPETRAPMRTGVELFADEAGSTPIGQITSGGFGPSIEAPMAFGRVETANSAPGTVLFGALRGKMLPVQVVTLPFVPARFKR